MERSRIRTLLGLGLLVVGTCLLIRAMAGPVVDRMPWANHESVVVEVPAMPEMPEMAPLPEMPPMPPLSEIPSVPPLPLHAPVLSTWSMWLNPVTIVLALLVLLLWRRNRTLRERPLA